MKVKTPLDKDHIKIRPHEKVLDVGSGNRPFKRANVLVDKYERDNTHRGSDLRIYEHQKFISADGTHLPFADKEFDYVNCCHLAEHLECPSKLFDEISRVGKRGYVEVPSLIGEFLAPKSTHLWVSLDLNDKLVMMRKSDLGFAKPQMDFGKLFLTFLDEHFLAYKILLKQCPDLFTVRQQWKDKIEYQTAPAEPQILDLFQNPWTEEVIRKKFKPKSKVEDTIEVWKTFCKLFTGKILRTLSKNNKELRYTIVNK